MSHYVVGNFQHNCCIFSNLTRLQIICLCIPLSPSEGHNKTGQRGETLNHSNYYIRPIEEDGYNQSKIRLGISHQGCSNAET